MAHPLSNRERYDREFNRASEAMIRQLRQDPRRFLEYIKNDVDLKYAFKTPDELSKVLAYDFRKEKVDRQGLQHTTAALGLHQLWKDFRDNKAQTPQEIALAHWVDGLITDAVDEKAEEEAEREIAA